MKRVFQILGAIFAFFILKAFVADEGSLRKQEDAIRASDWSAYAKGRFDDPSAVGQITGKVLTLTYFKEILTGGWAISNFNVSAAAAVPDIFKKASEVDQINLIETAKFHDRRGNESVADLIRATFTRAKSDSIHWDKILYSDVPRLANNYWAHPSLSK